METKISEKGETYYQMSTETASMMTVLPSKIPCDEELGVCLISHKEDIKIPVFIKMGEAIDLARALCDLGKSEKNISEFIYGAERPLRKFLEDRDAYIETLNGATDAIIGLRGENNISDDSILDLLRDIKWLRDSLIKFGKS